MTDETEMNVTYQNGWAVPAGWKLVPEEPTYELECEVGGVRMDEEFFLNEYANREKIREICRAVVKYSPQPPKAPDYNPGPLEVSVVGMPEFDALIDHIYEEGTNSEAVIHLANKLVRAAIQSHISYARNAQYQGDGDAGILRTAAEYHYAQAACPRDQFGNTSNHRNPRLEAWHRQVADAITAIIAPPSAKEKKT